MTNERRRHTWKTCDNFGIGRTEDYNKEEEAIKRTSQLKLAEV